MRLKIINTSKQDLEAEVNNWCDYLAYKGNKIIDIVILRYSDNVAVVALKYE